MSDGDAHLAKLAELHEQTDRRFSATTAALPTKIGCGSGCFSCCVDELTVWEIEAERIRQAGLTIQTHQPGMCAFLDRDGRCQAYEVRPYVCRSQGAVLRWYDDVGERRASCDAHLAGLAFETLPESATFELGPAEHQLLGLATAWHGATGRRGLPLRIALRDLAEALATES
ncbi:MAG: YkgJ family cysteine cluster protein [Myxococcales bacterium]|nr:YkgJ family cysteine cluster protein [Myxococcales bacterium]